VKLGRLTATDKWTWRHRCTEDRQRKKNRDCIKHSDIQRPWDTHNRYGRVLFSRENTDTGRQADRRSDRQADRLTDGQTDRQADRQLGKWETKLI